ncbi:glycosyltransferase family 4 protein [Aquimarina algiphila]|uniref:glycosyltransferase family 4 protein n=1 Tax=Aquimarina algiphila TaxID=2047982 RepID=UPI00232F5505|nr:glycosyltransferase family 4 protein [Aquimarina algiphila]
MEHACDILAIGQAEDNSGFCRVFNNLFEYLSLKYNIVHFGINYKGECIKHKWIVEPNIVGDIMGEVRFEVLINEYNPKLIFMCHDHWLYGFHLETLKRLNYRHKTIFYCPIEFEVSDSSRIDCFKDIGKLVFYTNYGYNTFINECKRSYTEDFFLENRENAIVPHGVDTSIFYPLTISRRQIRKKMFPNRPELWDAFIFLNANRNTSRKRIDLTIEAFAKFNRKQKEKAYLYLHTEITNSGVDLLRKINELGIRDQVILSEKGKNHVAANKHMNLIYNACDVGLNTCLGEGWGLIAFEHAAVGKPQILPNHIVFKELWDNNALLITVDYENCIHLDEFSTCMQKLKSDDTFRKKIGRSCQEVALNPKYSWKIIAKQWDRLFQKLL